MAANPSLGTFVAFLELLNHPHVDPKKLIESAFNSLTLAMFGFMVCCSNREADALNEFVLIDKKTIFLEDKAIVFVSGNILQWKYLLIDQLYDRNDPMGELCSFVFLHLKKNNLLEIFSDYKAIVTGTKVVLKPRI